MSTLKVNNVNKGSAEPRAENQEPATRATIIAEQTNITCPVLREKTCTMGSLVSKAVYTMRGG